MATIEKSIDVNVPVSTAYNQWTQFESFPHFMSGVEHVEQIDDNTLHWKANIAGSVQEWDAEITEQIPDERVAWKSRSGPENAGVVTFHRISTEMCRVTLQMEYQPSGFLQAVGNSMGVVSGQVQGDLERFREFIEQQGEETGAWRGMIGHGEQGTDGAELAGSHTSGAGATGTHEYGMSGGASSGSEPKSPGRESSMSEASQTYGGGATQAGDSLRTGMESSAPTGLGEFSGHPTGQMEATGGSVRGGNAEHYGNSSYMSDAGSMAAGTMPGDVTNSTEMRESSSMSPGGDERAYSTNRQEYGDATASQQTERGSEDMTATETTSGRPSTPSFERGIGNADFESSEQSIDFEGEGYRDGSEINGQESPVPVLSRGDQEKSSEGVGENANPDGEVDNGA
jgi:ribosome-associated toxin RatA of RatAB toxin-antitoxin module